MIGTNILQITISGIYGAFVYTRAGAGAFAFARPLLTGSAFGGRIGAGATKVVDDEDITGYLGVMGLAGTLAVADTEVSSGVRIEPLTTVNVTR